MALLRSRREERGEKVGVMRRLGSAFANPLSLTLGTIAVASAVGDGVFNLGWLAPVTPLLLLGIGARERINTQAKKYDAQAETFPPRPEAVENPITADVLVAGYGGSTIRGVEASDKWKQVGAVVQRVLAEELGAAWRIPDLKVAFVNTMTKAEAKAADMEGQTGLVRGLLVKQYKGKSPAASVAMPDIEDARSLKDFDGSDYGNFFGATTAKVHEAVAPLGDSPLLMVAPHDFSRAPSVKWYTKWKFRGKVREHSEGIVKTADEYNRNRDGRPVKVLRADQEISDVLASDPERYFDSRLGRNLSDDGHELLGREIAHALIPTILEHAETMNEEQRQWRSRVAAARRGARGARGRSGGSVPRPRRDAALEEGAQVEREATQAKASYERQFSPRVRRAIPGAAERYRQTRAENSPSRRPAG